ncbi:Dihydroanticapsin 7-dehydrogenase [archaeon HR05]|jgi:3-oxoacyl-[acyl-carrier protein] reductase|uniref:3-oxoacyl-[acyl-carrier-protein] reductase FabG n=2 Tax=Candidatus Nitrosocaldaceae TaxID=1968910 RepID=A0A2K5AQ20_9ARCH|nr:Dihydroanticapsin 7-dehydrogenase [archaeon HR05]SPC33758.1 3-oxoacyl-[acyl-carrier-protein] reductase FabG [Candidatus Nitrosocaldus cavascurensis]
MILKDKIALVTGASRGIGEATARVFAKNGAKVAMLARDFERLRSVASSIDGDTLPIKADVTDEKDVQAAVNTVLKKYDRIDVLVNNVGYINDPTPFHMMHDEDWDMLININLVSTLRMTRAVLPIMMNQKNGCIINISSVAGIKAYRIPLSVYNTVKAGVIMFTKSIALEYAQYNIRCNCICPGTVRSKFLEPYLEDAEAREELSKLQPLGSIGEPEDVANAILYLASDSARWVTGTMLIIDGGLSIA